MQTDAFKEIIFNIPKGYRFDDILFANDCALNAAKKQDIK